MSWLNILLVTWVAVGLSAGLVVFLPLSRASRKLGYELEHNPIAWVPFAAACVLAGPALLVMMLAVSLIGVPVFGVMSLFGIRRVVKAGHQARLLDQGLEIYNEEDTVGRFVEWLDVECAEMVFTPPLLCPHLILRDGERVWLHMVESDELAPVLEQHGIPFDRRHHRHWLDVDDSKQP